MVSLSQDILIQLLKHSFYMYMKITSIANAIVGVLLFNFGLLLLKSSSLWNRSQ